MQWGATRVESGVHGGRRWRSLGRIRRAQLAAVRDAARPPTPRLAGSAARHLWPPALASNRSIGSARGDHARSRTLPEQRSHPSHRDCRDPMSARRSEPDHTGRGTGAQVVFEAPRSALGYPPKARRRPRRRRGSPSTGGRTPPTGGDSTVTNGRGRRQEREARWPRAMPGCGRPRSNRRA